jgi:flagellar hook-basal body complex protein FliE
MSDMTIRPDITTLLPISPAKPAGKLGPVGESGGNDDFAALLRKQLEQVSQIQNQADDGLKKILTGESDNLSEVFTAAKRAQVAFDLLMEIRNKLVDSYVELRQLRV